MMFKCYICGKEYETPIEAANCTIECTKKQEIEKEEQRRKAIEEQRRKESLKVLRDTITKQYKGLKNNINKYNELGPDNLINIKLSIGANKAVSNTEDEKTNKSAETTTSNEDTFTNYNFYEDTLNNFIKMLNKYL